MTHHSPAALRVLAQVGIHRDQKPDVTEPTLAFPDVDLFTMTENELHDLVYAATSQRLQLTMTKDRARSLAAEVANQACALALYSDYRHKGVDPRA